MSPCQGGHYISDEEALAARGLLGCKVCNYTWVPKPKMLAPGRDKPVMCPQCQSRKWDKPDQPDT